MFDQKIKDCLREASSENLKLIIVKLEFFMRRIVTDDETWLHRYDPETKQSMQWRIPVLQTHWS